MKPIEQITPLELEYPESLDRLNQKLEGLSAEQRVEWALHYLPANHIMTSSFGIQGALMLHLVTRIVPDIPVVLVDTGYLFPETYGFIDQLTDLDKGAFVDDDNATLRHSMLARTFASGKLESRNAVCGVRQATDRSES